MKRGSCILLVSIVLLSLVLFRCKKEDNTTLPEVNTVSAPFSVATTSVFIGIQVKSDGGLQLIECGVYLSTSEPPETTGSKLIISSDTGSFAGQITGLKANTTYYLKAYARNNKGESLGNQISFTTTGTANDYDNNIYETVRISNQLWLETNLKTTHFLNGDIIISTTPVTLDITSVNAPEYQWAYNGDINFVSVYGRLYTWYVVQDSRKICPSGWHVPTDAEWTILETYLGGNLVAGGNLKESGNTHWVEPYNTDATNISQFTALPAGYRDETGGFSYSGNYAYFWTSTEGNASKAWARSIYVDSEALTRTDYSKKDGFSVRCLKD